MIVSLIVACTNGCHEWQMVQCPLSPIWSMWLAIDFPFHDSSIVKQLISKCANKEASVADALNRETEADMEEGEGERKKKQIVQFNYFVMNFVHLNKSVPVSTRSYSHIYMQYLYHSHFS